MNSLISIEEMTVKELRGIARSHKIPGWHDMRKADIFSALLALGEFVSSKEKPSSPKKGSKVGVSDKEEKTITGKSVGIAAKPEIKTALKKEAARLPMTSKTPEPVKPATETEKTEKAVAEKKKIEKGKIASEKAKPEIAKSKEASKESAEKGKSAKPKTSPKPERIASRLSVFPESAAVPTAAGFHKKSASAPVEIASDTAPDGEDVASKQTVQDRQRANLLREKQLLEKTLETPSEDGRTVQDRIVLLVCGPYWLHTWWEISGALIARVRAAMRHLWHTADPVLRLHRVSSDMAGLIRRDYVADVPIRGGVFNWYLRVDDPPSSFLVEIGYKTKDGQFFTLLSSNIVETPQNYVYDGFGPPEMNWRGVPNMAGGLSPYDRRTGDYPGVAAYPAYSPTVVRSETSERSAEFDDTETLGPGKRDFDLMVDAEVVIKGRTSPDVQLTIKGERVWLKDDGSFLVRYRLPERRHVFPVVAVSRDGIETKTVVLAVERNTKNLETIIRDQNEED